MSGKKKGRNPVKGKARKVIDRKPSFLGWRTTDEEEVERRRWRGGTDIVSVVALDSEDAHFGAFRVRSSSDSEYIVEIRSLTQLENSCGCRDFETSGLGACKHIEGVLHALRRKGKRAFNAAAKRGSPEVEIYPPVRSEADIRVLWPEDAGQALHERLGPMIESLRGGAPAALDGLRAAAKDAPGSVRVSRFLDGWLDERQRENRRTENREAFLREIETGQQTLDILHHPLLPYQVDGMLHLAFGERALLADDMGLGKTVQAIAACELLRRLHGVERVLVVSPASLKAEWEEQIARFSELSTAVVAGPRAKRLEQYRTPAFFTLANYEQIIPDGPDINRILTPDVVILDEAQRIKNWQTKTASAVKRLHSAYAFVLTGTPLENRIDEIYSIVQYLDPKLLGPLFRFNRDYYVLDERGRPIDYKNLEDLGRRLEPVMLRRRKDEVEGELPGRTVTNYFVTMTGEQRLRYEDYERPAQRLISTARRRPLTKDEFDRLQQLLACMRMVCNTPYILDPANRDCPKLEELERILSDVLAEGGRKVLIFSEWVRMLELVRELAGEMNVEFAWHTGSVPQDRRRAEINRFKKDPACRLFLSSESGGVGLNLQAADTVINMDLPWNPAKLEQRIARAWRKHQTRHVSVVNLVCEDSIEHRMVYLLDQKQGLADGVLDGRGDLKAIRMPTGRAAFLERMEAMMKTAAAEPETADPSLTLRDDLLARHGDGLLALDLRRDVSGRETLLAVLDIDAARLRDEGERLAREMAVSVEVVDRAAFETIRRLEAAGLLRFTGGESRELHRSPLLDGGDERRQRLERARELAGEADHKLRMASLLAGGGFEMESLAPAETAASLALRSLAVASGEDEPDETEIPIDLADRLSGKDILPAALHRRIADFPSDGEGGKTTGEAEAKTWTASVGDLLSHVRAVLEGFVSSS